MRTTIEFDPTYALLTAELNPGESIKAEPGAMVAQAGVDMKPVRAEEESSAASAA